MIYTHAPGNIEIAELLFNATGIGKYRNFF